ncbi:MAG: CHAT domain-containing protein [Ginsengibacter sp.]
MITKTDKASGAYNIQYWFMIFFSVVNFGRKIIFITGILIFSGKLFCQCPDSKLFKERITFVFNSSYAKNKSSLQELLTLKMQMEKCNFREDSSYMYLMQKIAVLYFRQSDYIKAIDFTNESVRIAKKYVIHHSGSTLALVRNYSNLYFYYDAAGRLKDKYAACDSCVEYAVKGNSGFDLIVGPLSDKVEYLFNSGNYSLCIRDAKLGEDIIKKFYHNKDSIQGIAFFSNEIANALYFSQNIALAEKIAEDKISQFEKTGNGKQLGALYSLLGLINNNKQQYVEALSFFRKGIHSYSIIKYKKGCAQNLASIGSLYAKHLSKPDLGLQFCNTALKYADNNDSLFIFQQIANIYILKGMYAKARYFFQRAFNTVQYGMDETTMLKNTFQFPGFNQLQSLSDLTTDKGDAYQQEYYHIKKDSLLKKALNIYKKNDLFLAKIKNEQQLDLASNLVWRATARNLYEHAIEACYAGNNIEDAFYFFEKSRAVLLNDQINEQRYTSDADIAKQAALKKTTIELERKLETIPNSSNEYLAIQNELYIHRQEFAILTDTIKNKNPEFYQNYLDTVFVTVSQLRKNILKNAKALVEIFSGDSAVYILLITANNQSLTKINHQLYDSITSSFNSFIADRYVLNQRYKEFIKTARRLYNLIFPRIKPPDGSIIISPDGKGYPFEALVLNSNDQEPDYFLNHFATSYTYSAKYLTNRFAANPGNRNSVLGLAPVQYENYQNLSQLPGSDKSLKIINRYFSNATNFTLKKATKRNFFKYFPGYTIIQLYTHASDSSSSNDPVIFFADSALYLSDLIIDRKPVTQLVVLSACETANGKLYQGEGIFSFNRGFAALGIPAAISNLWSVENESTYKITELFYKYLSQGLPTDVSLQKAKLDFIHTASSEEKKLPYFWAGSVLTGKVDILKSPNTFPWVTFVGLIILLIIVVYSIVKILRVRNHENKSQTALR